MMDELYRCLGLKPGATKEEVERAYRKKQDKMTRKMSKYRLGPADPRYRELHDRMMTLSTAYHKILGQLQNEERDAMKAEQEAQEQARKEEEYRRGVAQCKAAAEAYVAKYGSFANRPGPGETATVELDKKWFEPVYQEPIEETQDEYPAWVWQEFEGIRYRMEYGWQLVRWGDLIMRAPWGADEMDIWQAAGKLEPMVKDGKTSVEDWIYNDFRVEAVAPKAEEKQPESTNKEKEGFDPDLLERRYEKAKAGKGKFNEQALAECLTELNSLTGLGRVKGSLPAHQPSPHAAAARGTGTRRRSSDVAASGVYRKPRNRQNDGG